MNPKYTENQIAFNASPESRKAEREEIAKQVAEWLAAGNEIKQMPVRMDDEQRAT